jgi:hypothetical protein
VDSMVVAEQQGSANDGFHPLFLDSSVALGFAEDGMEDPGWEEGGLLRVSGIVSSRTPGSGSDSCAGAGGGWGGGCWADANGFTRPGTEKRKVNENGNEGKGISACWRRQV